jgi:hypothetical protein
MSRAIPQARALDKAGTDKIDRERLQWQAEAGTTSI